MIEISDVAHDYGGAELFSGVNLTLPPGAFLFLTGPSGAGKTTFLKLCYGELFPSRGEVRHFGQSLTKLSRDDLALSRRRIGVVHQDCQFLDHLPLAENVLLPLAVAGANIETRREELAELLAWVGLAARAEALPPSLSGGERQRAALARAVMMSPDIILADEPTGNLDWEMSVRLMTLLIELNRLGKAVLIATHDLALIRTVKSQVAARVLRIAGGKLQQAGADL